MAEKPKVYFSRIGGDKKMSNDWGVTDEVLSHLTHILREKGPGDKEARATGRRFAAGQLEGDWVVYDHQYIPTKIEHLPDGFGKREAETIANFWNCITEFSKGMDVTQLEEFMYQRLDEEPPEIMGYIISRFGRKDFPEPSQRVAI